VLTDAVGLADCGRRLPRRTKSEPNRWLECGRSTDIARKLTVIENWEGANHIQPERIARIAGQARVLLEKGAA